jgi:hypothetical protein
MRGCRLFCDINSLENHAMMANKARKRREWIKEDVRNLKAFARDKIPARKIALTLKRTEGVTRQKAFSLGVLVSRA